MAVRSLLIVSGCSPMSACWRATSKPKLPAPSAGSRTTPRARASCSSGTSFVRASSSMTPPECGVARGGGMELRPGLGEQAAGGGRRRQVGEDVAGIEAVEKETGCGAGAVEARCPHVADVHHQGQAVLARDLLAAADDLLGLLLHHRPHQDRKS